MQSEGGGMAMPQRDEKIEAIKQLDALLEYAVMHNDEADADRLRRGGDRPQKRVKDGTFCCRRRGGRGRPESPAECPPF